jgi:two-component system, NtrC family, sensor kinase
MLNQTLPTKSHTHPITFIHSNLAHASEYYDDLLSLIHLYQQEYPHPSSVIQQKLKSLDLAFLQTDIQQILQSMEKGSERIGEIVQSCRNFSRLDESTFKAADLHEGLEATLMILQNRLHSDNGLSKIEIVKDFEQLPQIYCSPRQLNQVFLNLLNNAIDALEEANQKRTPEEMAAHPNTIWIRTRLVLEHQVEIAIADNALGISDEIRSKIFDPFFTTKPVGQGTGLGLSVSYQIVTELHGGELLCESIVGQHTEFMVVLPLHAQNAAMAVAMCNRAEASQVACGGVARS